MSIITIVMYVIGAIAIGYGVYEAAEEESYSTSTGRVIFAVVCAIVWPIAVAIAVTNHIMEKKG